MYPVNQNEPINDNERMYAPTVGKPHMEMEICAKITMLAAIAIMFSGPLPVRLRKAKVDSLSEMPQIMAVRVQRAMRVSMPSMRAPCRYHTPKLATPLAPSMRWTVLNERPMASSKSMAFFNSRKGGLALHRFVHPVLIKPRADVHEGGS